MNKTRSALIAELVADTRVIDNPGRTERVALMWLVCTCTWTAVGVMSTGVFPARAWAASVAIPRYGLELAVGAATLVALTRAAFSTAIPQPGSMWRRAAPALVLFTAWIALHAWGMVDPASAPDMRDKRAHCSMQILAIAGPAMAFGLFMIKRWWPLDGAWSGALIGLAAGSAAVISMQVACIYLPGHIVLYHFVPGLGVGVLGTALGAAWLR
jgi:hypothetical protein